MTERLRPITLVTAPFARLLAAHFVPTWIPPDATASLHERRCRVPPVCAEFHDQWISPGPLQDLQLETVAVMARDAFVAEGGQLRVDLSFNGQLTTSSGVSMPKASSLLAWANLYGITSKP